jgi:hypothetical protein
MRLDLHIYSQFDLFLDDLRATIANRDNIANLQQISRWFKEGSPCLTGLITNCAIDHIAICDTYLAVFCLEHLHIHVIAVLTRSYLINCDDCFMLVFYIWALRALLGLVDLMTY